MADQTTQTIIIDAPPARCFDIVLDVERYPEWAPDIKSVEVRGRETDGRAGLVAYRAAAMGRSTSYVLRYYYGTNPLRVSWRLEEGDVVSRMDGDYILAHAPGDPASTEVTYHLSVDMRVPLPSFVKRRAEARIVRTALLELKTRAELSVAG
ncbi:MAG: SRPBCC family protein [Acidimicrobiia bacterium]|nr:SRPBCC family protein [Acidimicrobiia bacterium]